MPVRTLNVMDELRGNALLLRLGRKLNSTDVIEVLSRLFVERGTPQYLRSDNGPEFIARKVRFWLKRGGSQHAVY